jgi:3-hydroxyisobutyrate dehydrogenase
MSLGSTPVIGFVGLGRMGSPMAARLIEAGHRVLGFDLAEPARAGLTATGGEAVGSAAEAAAADVVILMLPDSAAVESVIGSADVQAALRPSSVVVDMGSSEPLRTVALAESLAGRVAGVIDAPVSGGVSGAEAGTLTVMVGGSDEVVADVLPLLQVLGSNVVHVGGVGAGHALKALNNLMSATHLWISSEALRIGQSFGLDAGVMLDVVNSSSGRSGSTQVKWPRFVLPETFDSGFALRLMLKDMGIAVRLGERLGAEVGLAKVATDCWAAAADELPATADHTEIVRWIDAHAGGAH